MIITQDDMSYAFAKKIIAKDRHPVGWVDVEFADGIEEMPIQQVLLLLPIWEILRKLNRPVYKRHILHDVHAFSKSSFQVALTSIYSEIYPDADEKIMDNFIWAIWETINDVDDFGIMELPEHHCGISLVDLVEIVKDPKVEPLTKIDLDNKFGTDVIEMKMNDVKNQLTKLLSTRGALKNDALTNYQQADILNPNQIMQSLIAFGLRTEVNNVVIPRAVRGSSLSGMRDIYDIAIEPQAARLAAIMNHEAIRSSQYWGRKLHLLACVLERIYKEDCGAHLTIPVQITASTYKNYIGKNIIAEDGSIVALTPKVIRTFFDHTVNMITVGGCRHTDGICKTCAGLLTTNIPAGLNVGINSSAELVAQVSQMILSTKHLIKTFSQIYYLPSVAEEYFVRMENGIHLQKKYKNTQENWSIGIYFEDLYGSQSDLLEINDDSNVPEERFSSIKRVLVRAEDGYISEIPLTVEGQTPFLTLEYLLYMKEKYSELVTDENVLWVPMKGIPEMPVFRAAIINDSMFAYVKSVIKFLENGMLTKHKTFASALTHFSELVWAKVPKISIFQIEVILKAHMIVGGGNWDIPVVNNLNKVHFGKTVDIIQNRNLSSQFSLQGHRRQFASADTYMVPKSRGAFDRNYDIDRSWIRK